MKENQLEISLSDDNRPHIETTSNYEKSLFRLQYDQSFTQINSILFANHSTNIDNDRESNNNIVVFDGDRGTGKTSCMLSVANMLEEKPRGFFGGYPEVEKWKFIKLPMLEPSFFDQEHNAVTLFVSRLYKEYQNAENKCDNEQKRHELLNQFVRVQQSIKCILGKFEPKDGLDYLVGLSSAVDLRTDIRLLVKLFLEYTDNENSILLILIDDIDINPVMAEEMAEQVRKYLVLPNTLVLVSMKIAQLEGILCRNYAKEYINSGGIDETDKEEINDRVEKYITKLFPRAHRIYMPQPELILYSTLKLDDSSRWNYNLPEDLTIRQIVPELIFKKTRYLFYNTNKRESFIVPRNLRDLRQLLNLLLSMPDYADEDELHPHNENKLNFKKYFFEDWTTINFDEKQRNVASQLVSVKVMEELNYTTLDVLSDYTNPFSWNQGNNVSIDEVLERLNNASNISLGDVLSTIRVIENANPVESNRKFLFFIRSLYSIRLYEAYDTITMNRENKANRERYSHTIVNRGLHRSVRNDYEAIVGGTVCNAEIFDYLPLVTETVHASTRFVSKESVVALAKLCLEHWDKDGNIYVKLLEMVMMSIYYDDTSNLNMQNNFRKSENICYRVINSGATKFRFDIGAFIFNLCRPQDSIDRFRTVPELNDFFAKYGDCSKDKYLMKDLYEKMESDNCRQKAYKLQDERWRSYCCFRNMEVLEDFLNFIRGRVKRHDFDKKKTSNPTKPINSVIAFFQYASEYFIKTYDRYDTEELENTSYTIHFNFFVIIYNLLNNETFKSEFEKIYYSIEIADESKIQEIEH